MLWAVDLGEQGPAEDFDQAALSRGRRLSGAGVDEQMLWRLASVAGYVEGPV